VKTRVSRTDSRGMVDGHSTIREIVLGHAVAIEGTQDPVIGVEGRGSERALAADLAVEAMPGPASVALELLAKLAHVLPLDLVDGGRSGRNAGSRSHG
jgi:hypothetical protein